MAREWPANGPRISREWPGISAFADCNRKKNTKGVVAGHPKFTEFRNSSGTRTS